MRSNELFAIIIFLLSQYKSKIGKLSTSMVDTRKIEV